MSLIQFARTRVLVINLLNLVRPSGRSRARLLWVLLFICLLSSSLRLVSYAQEREPTASVDNLRIWHSPTKTRVVFDVSNSVKHSVFTLGNPERVVVDIQGITFSKQLPKIASNNPHIRSVRTGVPKPNVLRVVFELKKPLQTHSFLLTPNELYAHRLVLDLLEDESQTQESNTLVSSQDGKLGGFSESALRDKIEEESKQVTPESEATKVPLVARTPKKLTIAIDAGHGGEDPGALGHRGSREKVITLSIAKRLEQVINADSRMQAFLVRTGDYYIDLSRRRIMAKEKGADIFVSIHADAFIKRSANGLSVFALSQRGATSAMARALADKENASDLIGGVSLANKDVVLAQVLVDLSMTNTISESVNLGGRVLKELSKVGRLHSKRVEQAGFAVLKSPDMPSILIETGFITNLNEERKLRSSSYQKKLAKAIHAAIGDYYEQTPYYSQASYSSPVLASSASTSKVTPRADRASVHKVKRGDSLSSIALKYGTTIAALKRENNLRRDTVMLGQRLKIPQTAARANASVPSVHVVKRGDSLSKISARYNVTINALKRFNGLQKNTVYLGQKIKIPGGSSAVSKPREKPKPAHHTVKRGDTLSEIAERYGVSMKRLMRANNMRSRTVRLGQKLKIP